MRYPAERSAVSSNREKVFPSSCRSLEASIPHSFDVTEGDLVVDAAVEAGRPRRLLACYRLRHLKDYVPLQDEATRAELYAMLKDLPARGPTARPR